MTCLHWFSPLPPAATGIADYTASLVPLLQEENRLVIWTDQKEWDPSFERYAPVRRFEGQTLQWTDLQREAPGIDHAAVFHIGNNGAFHKDIWEVSRRLPGTSVLHDTRLQHLFAHIMRDCYQDRDLYLSVMSKYYGAYGAKAAESFWAGGRSTEEMAERFPLAAFAAEPNFSSVVHSEESLTLLDKEGCRSATYIPFPYAARQEEPIRDPGPPFRITVCGYLGPNRRIESLLKALAGFPLRDKFRLEIYGRVWDPVYIKGLIQETGLQQFVTLQGFKPTVQDLDVALRGAHLGVNLRFPTMGEASMIQLRLWDHGIPSMVTPVGWYADLPRDTVVFVRPDNEIEDIRCHLHSFLEYPDRFAQMGDRARVALKELHDPRIYVRQLLEFISLTRRFAARKAVLATAARVGSELGAWLPARSLDDMRSRVSGELRSFVDQHA